MSSNGDQPVTATLIGLKPWRYIGYRGFSEWLSSDDDFFVLRRFDTLAARTLLLLQWEISKLETQLADADRLRMYEVVNDLNNGSFEADDDERQELLATIKDKLKEYYDLFDAYSALRNKPKATKESRSNLENWLRNHPAAISDKESAFIEFEDDLINVRATERSPLRRWLEKSDIFQDASIFKKEPTNISKFPSMHDPSRTFYHKNNRIDNVTDFLICLGGLTMLICPLWGLLFIESRTYQLALITLCITFFLAMVQTVTSARPFESLAATAAYTAVLMVFVQIGLPDNS